MSRKIYDLSPSNLHYINECAGQHGLLKTHEKSILEIQKQNPPDNTQANRGTAAHLVIELVLQDFLDEEGEAPLIEILESYYNDQNNIDVEIEVSDTILGNQKLDIVLLRDEDIPAIKTCLLYVRSILNDNVNAQLYTEIHLPKIYKKHAKGGTVDIYIITQTKVYVIDYKHGVVPVYVEDNTQLISYGVGIAEKYNWRHKKFTLAIVQPRAYGQPIKEWHIPAAKLLNFKKTLEKQIKRVVKLYKSGEWENHLKMNPGCMYCYANFICPKRRVVFTELLDTMNDTPPETPADKLHFSNNELQKVLDNADAVKSFIKNCQAYATVLISNHNRPIKGWKVVEVIPHRRYKPQAKKWLIQACKDANIPTRSIYKEKEIKTQTNLKKLLGVKIVDKALFTPKSTGVTLVKESDPRKAVSKLADTIKSLDN
ncbi:MAG: DUF2800 domain-containing protein [Planctomycetes bacterium]|nr:DUF2800 domain-containing protein [Planctomycetota bacterium]